MCQRLRGGDKARRWVGHARAHARERDIARTHTRTRVRDAQHTQTDRVANVEGGMPPVIGEV